MTDKYEALKAAALRIASELDDHNANLDRKARNVIRELVAERDALAAKLAEIEKQEPVARYIGESYEGSLVQLLDDVSKETPLYLAPGANPDKQAVQKFVEAIKLDRHDWEDWPKDSREAFEKLAAADKKGTV